MLACRLENRLSIQERLRPQRDEETLRGVSRADGKSPMIEQPSSIHDLEPFETGGPAARKGFLFQDHVAARYCLEMVLSSDITAVWCETLDDITLVRERNDREEVEFVQVKAEQLDQLWSPAKLCEREKDAKRRPVLGSSILEKSLAHDRCRERCFFRIVTRIPPNSQLQILISKPTGSTRSSDKMAHIKEELGEKVPDFQSAEGHDAQWWADHATWEVGHSEEVLRSANLDLLGRVIEETGNVLYADQRQSLYQELLMKVIFASASDWKLDRDAGKFLRGELRSWFRTRIAELEASGLVAGGRDLARKLDAAGLDSTTVNTARALRMSYRRKRIQPDYLKLRDVEDWEDRVRARLQGLRAALDTGEFRETGAAFHKRSLDALEQLRIEIPVANRPSEDFLIGCMYFITDLCQHHFVKASP